MVVVRSRISAWQFKSELAGPPPEMVSPHGITIDTELAHPLLGQIQLLCKSLLNRRASHRADLCRLFRDFGEREVLYKMTIIGNFWEIPSRLTDLLTTSSCDYGCPDRPF